MVDGLISCSRCNATALARLLAWRGENLDLRMFSLAEIDSEPARTFLRNIASDYCDLTRKQAEWEALIATAMPTRIGVFQLPKLLCVDVRPLSVAPDYPDWRQLSEEDSRQNAWWAEFKI
jgi:hypothetical protein